MNSTLADVRIVAHRGASADAPENTLAAYQLAQAQGADAIEGDFYLSKDGQIVCIHDATTKRTCGVEGKIAEMTFEQIRALDAGKWKHEKFAGQKVPTLAEFLAEVKPGMMGYVELKQGKELVEPMWKVVDASGVKLEQLVFISFKEDAIAEIKRTRPAAKACLLYGFKKDKQGKWNSTREGLIERARAVKADGISVSYISETAELVDAKLAKLARDAGLEFHVWTVDEPELAKKSIALGALSVTTNKPGWLRERLK